MADVQTNEATAAGFVVDGESYAIPSLYSFNMNENKIMYDLSGRPTEDWLLFIEGGRTDKASDEFVEDANARLREPGFLRALVHVAYVRAHPEADFTDVDLAVGRSNQVVNWAALFVGGSGDTEPAEDPTPAASTGKDAASSPSPQEPSKRTNEDSDVTPQNGSSNGSDGQVTTLLRTGTGG